jgi:hypothetical protein
MENAAARVISRWVVFFGLVGQLPIRDAHWLDLALTQRPACQREKRR